MNISKVFLPLAVGLGTYAIIDKLFPEKVVKNSLLEDNTQLKLAKRITKKILKSKALKIAIYLRRYPAL